MTLSHSLIRRAAGLAALATLVACGGGEAPGPETGSTATTALDAADERLQAAAGLTLPPLRAAPTGTANTNVRCNNWRIGAVSVDNVEVPAGTACQLSGTTVRGSVQVQPGGILLASNVQVAGSVQGDLAAHVQLTGAGTRVTGNVELEGGGGATLQSLQVAGDIFLNELSSLVLVRDTRVGGNVQLFQGSGGAELTGNRIAGNLQCTGNLPAPLSSNNTARSIEDQCLPGGGIAPPPAPLSGNVTCVGLTIGAIRLDSVIVPANASCTLTGTLLNGNIEVGANARLTADGVTVNGGLTSDAAASLRLGGGSSIGGSVQVQRGAGAAIADTTIRGDLQIDAMTGAVIATGNTVSGNLQAMGNRGGLSLSGNRMGGVMQCKDNLPAPGGSGNVATLKEDQCRGL